jgi:hypothetical protein
MTREEYGTYARGLYRALPKTPWGQIREGDHLFWSDLSMRVLRVPPARGYILVRFDHPPHAEERISRREGEGAITTATPEIEVVLDAGDHRQVLTQAVARGLKILPTVQYDYPALFTPVPAGWGPEQVREM